jgi:anaerobic carbon-monoxide dehydrogenase iron sulfur subunit
MHDLRVTVDEVRGFCDLPMRPGDYFEVRGGRIILPAGGHICLWALAALLPMFPVKQRDILDQNDWIPTTRHMCCPDPNGMVIYRIDRIGDTEDAAEDTRAIAETKHTDLRPPARLLVDEKICSGCLSCELACSGAKQDGAAFRPAIARIHVAKLEHEGIDRPLACRQCGQARCVAACPAAALSRHPQTKAVLLDESLCTQCRACAAACTFDAIRFHPETGFPLICDLCGGDPACVRRCATGALKYGRAGDTLPLAPAEHYLAPPDLPPKHHPGGDDGGEQA